MTLKIWRAKPSDRKSILDLSRHFPGDFLEYVVDDWIAQAPGGFYLAGEGDTLLACCALLFPEPGQGWLQGMRVHPSFQRQGIGSRLTSFLVAEAGSQGAERVGLLTAPGNHSARQLVLKQGFKPFQTCRKILFFGIPAEMKPDPRGEAWKPAGEKDLTAVWEYLQGSPVFREAEGYIFHPKYAFVPLSFPYFKELLEKEWIWLWRDNKGIKGLLVLGRREEEGHVCVLYLDLPREDLTKVEGVLAGLIHGRGSNFFSTALLDYQFDILQSFFSSHVQAYELSHWLIMERKE